MERCDNRRRRSVNLVVKGETGRVGDAGNRENQAAYEILATSSITIFASSSDWRDSCCPQDTRSPLCQRIHRGVHFGAFPLWD
jgi:hypothetical protein